MKVIGLTGNIGCGKSAVAKLFAELPSVLTINLDEYAKSIIMMGRLNAQIEDILGEEVFRDPEKSLSRIAAIIFNDAVRKKDFENLIHPLVWRLLGNSIERMKSSQRPPILVIVESAIIFETDSTHRFDTVIAVSCNSHVQRTRLRELRGMSDDAIDKRIATQISCLEKLALSDNYIMNDGAIEETAKQVHRIYNELKEGV